MLNKIRSKISADSESQYEYSSQFGDNESTYSSDEDSQTTSAGLSRRISTYSAGDDSSVHVQTGIAALEQLQSLHALQASSWKRALKHRSGTIVYVSKEKKTTGPKKNGKGEHQAPVFKGELDIEGSTPAEVFGVIGSRGLWDDWYKDGYLVENLANNSSLTYMCMSGIAGSSTRDLSLVERVEGSPTGTISFAATSVVTPKIPRVSGRVRANIALNGWVLEPIDGGTRATYYLLVNVKTLVPAFASTRYLARRPTCVAKVAEYLKTNGAPPVATVATDVDSSSPPPRRRRDSVSSKRSSRSTATNASSGMMAGLPTHVKTNKEAEHYAEIEKAQKEFKEVLNSNDWSLAVDEKGNQMWMSKKGGEGEFPIVKGEAVVEGVTTEQVLGTIVSSGARRIWDTRFQSSKLLNSENGFDQGDFVETTKAIFPTFDSRHYIITRAIDREDPTSDNATILILSRSISAPSSFTSPTTSTSAQNIFTGYLLSPHSSTSTKITHIAHLNLSTSSPLPIPIRRILISELALSPHSISNFINSLGHAPFFLRWGEGPATLENDGETGDLKDGTTVFNIGGKGTGTMKNGEQKCWFSWSEKMFERGLEVEVVPKEAVARIAKVEGGIERTLEIVWSEKVKDGARVVVKRAEGDGPEDVFVEGRFLDRTVGMEKGSGAGARGKKLAANGVENGGEKGVVGSVGAVNGAKGTKVNGDTSTTPKTLVNGVGSRSTKDSPSPPSTSSPTRDSPTIPSRDGSLDSSAGTKTISRGVGGIPEDACLIISKDLYFTRSQCAFLLALVFASYVWGKLS